MSSQQRKDLEAIREEIQRRSNISADDKLRWRHALDLNSVGSDTNVLAKLAPEQRQELKRIAQSQLADPALSNDQVVVWRRFVRDLGQVELGPLTEADQHHGLDLQRLRREVSNAANITPERRYYALKLLDQAIENPHDVQLRSTINNAMRRGNRSSGTEGTALCLVIVTTFLAGKYLEGQAAKVQPAGPRAKVN